MSTHLIFTHVERLAHLTPLLPESIALAKENSMISQVFARTPVPTAPGADHWLVFNRRMDALFSEDKRSTDGKLLFIERGPYGMDLVVDYIRSTLKFHKIPFDIADLKVKRLVDELEKLLTESGIYVPKTRINMTRVQRHSSVEIEDVEDEDDDDYNPPKRCPPEPQSPNRVYDSDGDESVELTLMRTKKKSTASTQSTNALGNSAHPLEIVDSGEESDGRSALRAVEEHEQKQGQRPGPANDSLKYYNRPIATKNKKGQKRWQFQCRYCSCVRTVAHTVNGKGVTFDDEETLPKLNNLASNTTECQKKCSAREEKEGDNENQAGGNFNLQKSVELMEAFLRDGELNPAVVATQKGFLRLFSAWILDESLPWTTGEAPLLRLLFKYLKINYTLPSDTTARNQLAHIFNELHTKVVREFMNIQSKVTYSSW